MIDDADFARVLAYARSLYTHAEALERAHGDLSILETGALRDWRGGLANEMTTIRWPEELADLEIAAAAMRTEAELWAEVWTEEVDARNLRVQDHALTRLHDTLV